MNTYVLLLSFLATFTCISLCVYIKFFTQNILIGSVVTFIMFFVIFSLFTVSFKNLIKSSTTKKEGLTTISGSGYKRTRNMLPLEDIYPANVPFQKSDYTFETMSKDYPIFPAKSNKTNLIRYWDNPSNGTCSLPHQCHAFYKTIKPEEHKKPTPPSWGSGIRVNFYDTCSFKQNEK